MEILYLSQADITALDTGMPDVIRIVEAALREQGEGRVEMPPKPGIHPLPQTFIHAMPAYLPRLGAAGMKWIACFPENTRRGLEQTTGVLVMNDPETGAPIAIMDAAWITAVRTAAITAIGAKHLARQDSRTLGIVGAGVQGRYNLLALAEVLPELREVRIADKRQEAVEGFIKEPRPHFPDIRVEPAASPETAVRGSDVVVTATMFYLTRPLVKAEWFDPGCFAAPLEADYAWEPAAVRLADKLVTDDAEQTRYFAAHGCFPEGMPPLYSELAEIVCGQKPGREKSDERIISICLGMALEDVALGHYITDLAQSRWIGRRLPLA